MQPIQSRRRLASPGLRASTQLAKKAGCSVRSSASTTGTSSWFCQYSGSSRVFIGDLHEAVPLIERRDVDGPYDRVVTPDVTCEHVPFRGAMDSITAPA